jgi:hypothetical protein
MTTLARLRFPSSQRRGDDLEVRPGRACAMTVRDSDSQRFDTFLFDGIFASQVTYHSACSVDMIEAYDRLVEVSSSLWLREVQARVADAGGPSTLKHYRIYLDDGPCYEFIAVRAELLNQNA